MNQKIGDRIILAEELKLGLSSYVPSTEVLTFLKKAKVQELAIICPSLQLPRTILDKFEGEVGEHVLNNLSGDTYKCDGETLTLKQRQHLIARYMVEIRGMQVYLNTLELSLDL